MKLIVNSKTLKKAIDLSLKVIPSKVTIDEDKLIHASNTIEDMIQLAKEAINEAVS